MPLGLGCFFFFLGLGFVETSLPELNMTPSSYVSAQASLCACAECKISRVSYKVTGPPGLGTQHYDPIEPELPP